MKKNIFRKVSLERLSSPEQLDQLMQVTKPRGWVALMAFGGLIVLTIIWSITGTIPAKVGGRGILIKTGGVIELVSPSSGRVIDVAVRAGDKVEAGQVVARIDQPALAARLQQVKAELEELQKQRRQTSTFNERDVTLRTNYLSQQRANIKQAIDAARTELMWLREKVVSREQLLEEGLITQQKLIDTKRLLRATQQEIEQDSTRLQQVEIDILALQNEKQQSSASQTFEINEQMRLIAQLEEELRRKSQVVSPYTGRVIEALAERGDLINKGTALMSLNLVGRGISNLEAVLYVSAQDGKKVEPGMQIQLAPASVQPEEYGRMVGTVTYVSDYPATSEGMMQLLENEQLITALSSGGTSYELHASITLDPSTPSGYKWTSSSGPPMQIQSGTLCSGTITIEKRHPVELVLPVLGEHL